MPPDAIDNPELLDLSLPTHRQAWSDRTAWVMACLSELAYVRFDPLLADPARRRLFEAAVEALEADARDGDRDGRAEGRRLWGLRGLVERFVHDPEAERAALADQLRALRLELLETFDAEGTQAILVGAEGFVALAFRGTEATSVADIRADARATIRHDPSGGRVHSGFHDAYEAVARSVGDRLAQADVREKPLFVTGHSLGGALATLAAARLADHPGGVAACYTFGSPRVGDEDWVARRRDPVHRVVNAADGVTMLPPGDVPVTILGWLVTLIPVVGDELSRGLVHRFAGYLHCGSMRYLTNCPPGDYAGVRILWSVSLFYRLKGFLHRANPLRRFLADHSIAVYRRKLERIAMQRNGLRDQPAAARSASSANSRS
jgi:hypothetical protein